MVFLEPFYGLRPWLVPGVVAALLFGLDTLGLGEPTWYVPIVELAFATFSLAVPAGLYEFARCVYSEAVGRVALCTGAVWYELAGFAHLPMPECVATGLIAVLLALLVRPGRGGGAGGIWLFAWVAMLAAAVRLQYAPMVLVLLGAYFLTLPPARAARLHLVTASGFACLAVGGFDALAWGAVLPFDVGFFHSYISSLRFNALLGSSPLGAPVAPYIYPMWLGLASGGLAFAAFAWGLAAPRRHALVGVLVLAVVVPHVLVPHKEYRYLFALIPMWLVLLADGLVRLHRPRGIRFVLSGCCTVWFLLIAWNGLLNRLPLQEYLHDSEHVPRALSVRFVRDHDPVFEAFLDLSRDPTLLGVWYRDRSYASLPGYYFLHRAVPFYDVGATTICRFELYPQRLRTAVSHILTHQPDYHPPGFVESTRYGALRVLRRVSLTPDVLPWAAHTPSAVWLFGSWLVRTILPDAPLPPPIWRCPVRFGTSPG